MQFRKWSQKMFERSAILADYTIKRDLYVRYLIFNHLQTTFNLVTTKGVSDGVIQVLQNSREIHC